MRLLKIVTALLLLAVPIAAWAEVPELPPGTKKARSIDELAAMFDVSSCKQCHAKIHDEWSQSAHSKAMVGSGRVVGGSRGFYKALLTYKDAGVKGPKDMKIKHWWPCADCHLPQLQYATDEVAVEITEAYLAGDQATLNKVGINCLVCHNLRYSVDRWQDGPPEPGVVYGTKEGAHPDNVYKTMKKSPMIKESTMCGRCHGVGPTFQDPAPTQCSTLYGSYLHAYIPAGGNKTCQECHMKDTGHRWPGFVTQGETVANTPNRAFKVDVTALAYQFLERPGNHIPKTKLNIAMTNIAGHRIPDA